RSLLDYDRSPSSSSVAKSGVLRRELGPAGEDAGDAGLGDARAAAIELFGDFLQIRPGDYTTERGDLHRSVVAWCGTSTRLHPAIAAPDLCRTILSDCRSPRTRSCGAWLRLQ